MAHVVLGLLLIAPQSLYDLIKAFEAGVSLLYSASSGSLKRSLDRLLEQGHIEVADARPAARGRKVYRVTEAGHREFREWMLEDLTGSDPETAALARLFFLGLIEADERPGVLRRVTARLERDLGRLENLQARLATAETPEQWQEVAAHQYATLDYGVAAHRHSLGWFRGYLERLEKSHPPQSDEH